MYHDRTTRAAAELLKKELAANDECHVILDKLQRPDAHMKALQADAEWIARAVRIMLIIDAGFLLFLLVALS